MKKHHCTQENAPKFLDWIKNRGGIAVWKSIDLSDLDKSWSSPAFQGDNGDRTPYPKPNWKCASEPSRIITDPADVEVMTDKEVKRFRVGVRPGSNGMSMKVTDGGTRRIWAAVAKAGDTAHYEFDYMTQEAVIYVADKIVPLNEWRPA